MLAYTTVCVCVVCVCVSECEWWKASDTAEQGDENDFGFLDFWYHVPLPKKTWSIHYKVHLQNICMRKWYLDFSCLGSMLAIKEALDNANFVCRLFHLRLLLFPVIRTGWICWIHSSINMGLCWFDNKEWQGKIKKALRRSLTRNKTPSFHVFIFFLPSLDL